MTFNYKNKNSNTLSDFRLSGLDVLLGLCAIVSCQNSPLSTSEDELEEENHDLVTDIDGNVYTTVEIDEQEWMVENLKTSSYRDGTEIPTGLSDSKWGNTTSGAYAIYPHEESEEISSDEEMVNIYGMRYNWYAVNDERGICPVGWRVPNSDDWNDLRIFLGDGNIGGQLKHEGTEYWESPNTGASNSSGFTALPGGGRYDDGGYAHLGRFERFWSSSDDGDLKAYRQGMAYSKAGADYYSRNKVRGFSVRCIRD